MKRVLCLVLLFATVGSDTAVFAAGKAKERFESSWLKRRAKDGPDAVQHEKAGPGWFTNLGPTGIRAMLTDKNGKTKIEGEGIQYVVKYLFPDSPAAGKIFPGDVITGVNGRPFKTPYTFGYWFGTGYEGPMLDVGRAVAESETKRKGKLSFLVTRKGKAISVDVQIKRLEPFTKTFPLHCKKTEVLKQQAIDYLVKTQEDQGRWHGAPHAQFFACMALMAQGKKYLTPVRKWLDLVNSKYKVNDGQWNWHLSFRAIAMSEYQMKTGDTRYMDYMKRVNAQFMRNATRFKNGTFGHIGLKEGSLGYGPMCGVTSLVVLAWTMMEKAGVPIDTAGRDKALAQLDMKVTIVSKQGDFKRAYGWAEHGAHVERLNPAMIARNLVTISRTNRDIEGFNKRKSPSIDAGLMQIVHSLYPWQSYSKTFATSSANYLVRTRRNIIDGHGSGMLHAWSSFAALGMASNLGHKKPLRLTLDSFKPYVDSARCHDGSFYIQPQRDPGGDYGRGGRTLATGLWLLVLSIPDKGLQILGQGT